MWLQGTVVLLVQQSPSPRGISGPVLKEWVPLLEEGRGGGCIAAGIKGKMPGPTQIHYPVCVSHTALCQKMLIGWCQVHRSPVWQFFRGLQHQKKSCSLILFVPQLVSWSVPSWTHPFPPVGFFDLWGAFVGAWGVAC